MKKHPLLHWAVMASAIIASTSTLNAATNAWSGASGVDTNWSTAGNWNPSGQPNTGDDARFADTGAAVDAVTVNSTVSANRTIKSLWIGQTNGFHNININAGVTLTIAGTTDNGWGALGSDPNSGAPDPALFHSTLYVGTKTTNSQTQVVNGQILGDGTLVVSNLNNEILIRQFHPSGGAHRAILNMSGLASFVAKLGRIRVGDGEAQPINRSEGDLFLAKTNIITLSGTNFQDNVQLVVGNNDVNQNQSNPSFMILGGQNTLNLDEMLVGGKKQPGTIRGTNAFTTPTLTIRGSDGVGRMRAFRLGDASDQPSSGNGTTGIAYFNDMTVDMLVDTMSIGKSQSSGSGNGSLSLGRLLLGPGTVDVNTLDIAFRMDGCAYSNNAATGSVDLSNTVVVVNSLLRLGRNVAGQRPTVASLALNGGSVTVRTNMIIQGAVSVTNINGVLAFVQPGALTVSNIFLSGGTISNVSVIGATNSLTIANNGVVIGTPAYDMGNVPLAAWDVTGVSGGSLNFSNTFQGGGTVTGNLVQGTGGTLGAGTGGTIGTLQINGNLTLNAGTLRYDLASLAASPNDLINVSGTLQLNATNDVVFTALGGGFDTNNPYTLINYGTLIGNQTYFRPAGPLALSRYTFTFDTSVANVVRLNVGGTGAKNLTWVGDGSANLWNAQGATNWNDGIGASQFFSLDNVTFNDSGSASPAVSMSGTLIPGAMTVNNTTKSYGFGGTGGLAASGSLTKTGTNSLTFTNGAGNSFSSLVSVQNGTLTFGNAGQNAMSSGLTIGGTGAVIFTGNNTNSISTVDNSTALTISNGTSVLVANAGANSIPSPIQLDGALTFNQSVSASLNGSITGAGILTKNGTGTLTMNGDNSALSSVVQINAGTIKAGSGTALGIAGAIITNSATLDLGGRNLNTLPGVTASGLGVGGNGAIVSVGAPLLTGTVPIGLSSVTLTGDAAVGGSGPWDTDPVKNLGVWGINNGALNTGSTNFNLIKVGLNQFGLSGSTTVDSALGNIDVQAGLLSFQGSATSMGDPGSNITIHAGATVSFDTTSTLWDKKFILQGDGTTPNIFNYNGANTIVGSIALNGACVIGAAPASRGTPTVLSLNGPISGTGSLIKPSQDTLSLGGTNTYGGVTTVTFGTLSVEGVNRGAGTITVSGGGALAGLGIIHSPVVIQSTGTLSPGNTNVQTGTLTISNSLSLAGITAMDVTKSGVDFTSDLVTNVTSLTYGGQLQLNLAGDPLAAGDAIKLFNFNSATLGFSSISPAIPGAGLVWNTSTLTTDGKIRVSVAPAAQPHFVSATISSGKIILTGTNGTDSGNYYVLASTNLLLALSNWTPIGTDAFVSGNFNFTNNIDPSVKRQFYIIQLP